MHLITIRYNYVPIRLGKIIDIDITHIFWEALCKIYKNLNVLTFYPEILLSEIILKK